MNNKLNDYTKCIITVLIAYLVSIFGSIDALSYMGIPILTIIASISFIIHGVVFIPSYLLKTEKYFDITGTLAYIIIFITTYYLTIILHQDSPVYLRSKITLFCISIWAIRLGLFLLIRVFRVGEDKRFREVKKSFSKFLVYFTVSGLWVFLTTCNALTLVLNNSPLSDDLYFKFGLLFWLLGFIIEVISDEQKRRFRRDLNNKNNFIQSGLWKISRHPNYFGEIMQWIAIAIISLPVLIGWQYLTLISPIFVIMLLTKASGINILEKNSDDKWSSNQDYINYKKNTPVLVPFINLLKK